ncbi:serine aminopeptidase domain-containing protein [Thermodesulfobacteriota bacterium]
MKIRYGTRSKIFLTVLCLVISLFLPQFSLAQDTARKPRPKMGFSFQMDPRAKEMSYHFKDADKDLKYGLFVSSKVSKNKKAPLIVTLHGLGVGFEIMLSKQAVDLAEEGGYILVGPMGYNERGWYGMPFGIPGKTPPKRAQTADNTAPKPKPKGSMFSNPNDPPNLRELSEKDVMNVLDMVRKEYNIDENRIYLMGHSMGGAGTLYLGTEYPSIWAALAPIAPAAFGIESDRLEKIKNMPIIFVHGGADELVPVDISRRWSQKAKELKMTYEYNEIEGLSHGPIIMGALPSVYEFFSKHSK